MTKAVIMKIDILLSFTVSWYCFISRARVRIHTFVHNRLRCARSHHIYQEVKNGTTTTTGQTTSNILRMYVVYIPHKTFKSVFVGFFLVGSLFTTHNSCWRCANNNWQTVSFLLRYFMQIYCFGCPSYRQTICCFYFSHNICVYNRTNLHPDISLLWIKWREERSGEKNVNNIFYVSLVLWVWCASRILHIYCTWKDWAVAIFQTTIDWPHSYLSFSICISDALLRSVAQFNIFSRLIFCSICNIRCVFARFFLRYSIIIKWEKEWMKKKSI